MSTTEKILPTMNSWRWGELIVECSKRCFGGSSRSSVRPWGTLPQLHNNRSHSWQRDIIIWRLETRGALPCTAPQCDMNTHYRYSLHILLTKLPLVEGFADNCSNTIFGLICIHHSVDVTIKEPKQQQTTEPCVLPENWPSSWDIAPLCHACTCCWLGRTVKMYGQWKCRNIFIFKMSCFVTAVLK